jgi:putative ABC transport system permease protein
MTCVMLLVVALVAMTMVVQSRGRYAVLRALGYTSRDLVAQAVATHLPAVLAGAALGAAAGTLLQNPALVSVLRGIGIMKADFSLPWWLPAGIALAASLAAAGMIWWRSRSLGRVGTRSLLRDAA